ncbi:MAG: ATP-binding protein [Deltaproteobacteria bacterium]|nr:ATP-binding protein [Deltaproteobacteria bacterium]
MALAREASIKAALLKQYFRDILYRDVVARHRVRDVRALEQVAHHYLVNTASLATHNRIKNTYGLAMDQVRSYTAHLEESYLIRSVARYSPKVSQQARAPRKVYAVDVGMRNAVSFRFSEDIGRLAETVVHGQLSRDEDARLFYWAGELECDFNVHKGAGATAAIQVCQEPDENLPEREVKGLLEAMRYFDLKEGTIVTNRASFEREVEGRMVRAQPLWLWLLDASGQLPAAREEEGEG